MRRRHRWAAAGALAVLALGAPLLWPRPGRITRENFDRIQEGMSAAEAEAILGPLGIYFTGPVEYDLDNIDSFMKGLNEPLRTGEFGHSECWNSDAATIVLRFDAGKVARKLYVSSRRADRGLFDDLLWRVKLRWRRWFP